MKAQVNHTIDVKQLLHKHKVSSDIRFSDNIEIKIPLNTISLNENSALPKSPYPHHLKRNYEIKPSTNTTDDINFENMTLKKIVEVQKKRIEYLEHVIF